MDILIFKDHLMNAIQGTQGAVSTKSSLPILSNLLLEAKDKTLKITATDLEIAVSCVVEAQITEPGSITLPAKRLHDIIREMWPGEGIKIQVKKNNSVLIEGGKSQFKIVGTPKDDFPRIPEFDASQQWVLSQAMLGQMIKLTSFAMSRDEARYVLNGILFAFLGKSIRLVATDGRRLALVEKDLDKPISLIKNIIIPTKTIQELNRHLGETGDVGISLKDNQLQFKIGEVVITSRLIEGEFPNYEQVIPKKTKEHVQINTQEFLSAAKRASIFTNQESQSIKIDLSKNRMVISKNTPDVGEVREELAAEYSGGDFTIGFNPSYLIDVLKNIKEETIKFELIDPEKPGVIRSNDNYTYIVLPMQLS